MDGKMERQWHLEIGDKIPVIVNFESLCLFDEETEELIKKPTDIGNYVFGKEVLI